VRFGGVRKGGHLAVGNQTPVSRLPVGEVRGFLLPVDECGFVALEVIGTFSPMKPVCETQNLMGGQ